MRIENMRKSDNVEDRRRVGPRAALGGGLGGLVIIVLALFFGVDPRPLLYDMDDGSGLPTNGLDAGTNDIDPGQDAQARLVAAALGDKEDVWDELFRRQGRTYERPTLVLFRGKVQSACGLADAAVGPFYCPGDSKLYIDLSFYDALSQRFGAPGDFAQAYVIAHEVGHHVQNLLGISDMVHREKRRLSEADYNKLSVRLELQADFFAGVWAHHAHRMRDVLESGDIEEGLRAASAIGDDALQRQSRGYVVPDSFTHGSSAQRVRWFRKGLETGDPNQRDTFAQEAL